VSESRNRLTVAERARRWDALIKCLQQPDTRDVYLRRLSGVRRAVWLLLAVQETLTAELKAYNVTLESLYLEAADGLASIEGVLNLIPTYITEQAAGDLCQADAGKDWTGLDD
jgi:hypothetical protein